MRKEIKVKIDKSYEKKVHKILKTYNSILVKCKNIPTLSDKNIIMVENMDSMINAQIETRKPILYFQENESISFVLLDGTETYVYVLKAREEIQSEIEHIISNLEVAKNTFVKEILSKIEKILLNGSIEKENLLTANELKYLESVKEENSQFKNNANINQSQSKIQNQQTEESMPSKDLALVPIKKQRKLKIFNKKIKKEKVAQKQRSRKIG